jgi:hypothetical protein
VRRLAEIESDTIDCFLVHIAEGAVAQRRPMERSALGLPDGVNTAEFIIGLELPCLSSHGSHCAQKGLPNSSASTCHEAVRSSGIGLAVAEQLGSLAPEMAAAFPGRAGVNQERPSIGLRSPLLRLCLPS